MHLRALIAALAVLIGAALVFVIAQGSDDQAARERVTSLQEKRAVRVEARLARHPTDKGRLLGTMEAWIQAGSEQLKGIDARAGQPVPSVVTEDYEAGLRAWERYLTQAGASTDTDAASMAAGTFYQLVEIGSADPERAMANAAGAVRAMAIVVKHDPNLLTLSNLALYRYFNGEYAAGDMAGRRAALDVPKSNRRSVLVQLAEQQERGEKFVARVQQGARELRETGKEELAEPIKGYGTPAGINGYEPGTAPKPGEIR